MVFQKLVTHDFIKLNKNKIIISRRNNSSMVISMSF